MAIYSMTPPEAPITYLYSHGIADDQSQAFLYTLVNPPNENPIINNKDHNLVTFNYPDAGKGIIYPKIEGMTDLFNLVKHLKTISYRIDRAETSFAQENEIQALNEARDTIKTPIVCIGGSRGASAILTWLATAPEERTRDVKAVVLESPFGSMDDIVRNILGESLYQYPQIRSLGHNIIRFIFSKYDKNFTTPLEAAAKVPTHMPILIVCYKNDPRVPAWSSENLAKILQDTGHTVHCVTLEQGEHGKLIKGPDGDKYRNAVHAFYKKYGLDGHFNPEWAELGKDLI